jgi:hypothetical protein
MTNRFTTLAAAAAIFLGLSAPAAADPLSVLGSAGGWRIKGNHEACVGDRWFAENGTTLAFAVYVSGSAAILIQNRLWDIPAGTYPVTVSIDRGSSATFQTSFYAKEQALVLDWNLTADQISVVAGGSVFYAKVGFANYQYSLSGSAEMLRAVMDCVGGLRRAANPFAGAPSAAAEPANPFAETASNPYRRM